MASVNDYQAKSVPELKEELLNLRKEQFNLRMQKGVGQAPKPHLFTEARRNIARLKMVMADKQSVDKKQAGTK
jgi:large subunit ribosomal protein L29